MIPKIVIFVGMLHISSMQPQIDHWLVAQSHYHAPNAININYEWCDGRAVPVFEDNRHEEHPVRPQEGR